MATLAEAQDVYDRHHLHGRTIHSGVADVILKLEAERDALKTQLHRSIPEDFATLDDYIRTLLDENTLFTYQSAERGFLLREMLASGEAHQGWIPVAGFVPRIRAVLDRPEDAEQRERAALAALGKEANDGA